MDKERIVCLAATAIVATITVSAALGAAAFAGGGNAYTISDMDATSAYDDETTAGTTVTDDKLPAGTTTNGATQGNATTTVTPGTGETPDTESGIAETEPPPHTPEETDRDADAPGDELGIDRVPRESKVETAVTVIPPETTEPVTDPVVTDPAVTDPPVTGPAVTDSPVTDPAVTEPPVTEPTVTDPAVEVTETSTDVAVPAMPTEPAVTAEG